MCCCGFRESEPYFLTWSQQRRGIQTIRQGVLYDFLGSGIFTTDGAFWQHSRAMLRPQFEKSQVSAIDQFEPYVQKYGSDAFVRAPFRVQSRCWLATWKA